MKNKYFLALMAMLIAVMSIATLYRMPDKSAMTIENRSTTQVVTFSLDNWMNTKLQNTIDSSFTDHFMNREQWLTTFYELQTAMTSSFSFLNADLSHGEVKIEQFEMMNRVTIRDVRMLVYPLATFNKASAKTVETNANLLNTVAKTLDASVYLYLIPQSRDSSLIYPNFSLGNYTSILDKTLSIPYDVFEVKTLDDYVAYYERTDHHWTSEGAYAGYIDLAKNLFGEEPVGIAQKYTFDQYRFLGSLSRRVANSIKVDADVVTILDYEYTPVSVQINGKEKPYGALTKYLNGSPELAGKYFDHYLNINMDSNIPMVFDSGNADKPNVLLIGNSFASAIRYPLSAHTSHLYYLSMDYLQSKDKNFNMKAFIKSQNIEKVIFMYQLDALKLNSFTSSLNFIIDKSS